MKVLVLRANPRKTGFTQRLGDLFCQGLQQAGALVDDVDLASLVIHNCLGCFHCWLVTPGQCVHQDDMAVQLQRFRQADVVVCATPIYYFSMSSYLKTFFERTFPLAKPGVQASGRGLTRNSIRYPEDWKGKKLITIVTGALHDLEVYQPVNATFQLIADSLDLELGGQLTRPESYLLDYPLSKPKTLKKIELAFVQAGREAGTNGNLSAKTMTEASLPLAIDAQRFRAYSYIYWQHALEMGPEALVPAEVQKRVAGDAGILMREMVRCADKEAITRIKAVLQFEFPDRNLTFQVHINHGQCELNEDCGARFDLRIQCATEVWAALFTRQLDIRAALREHQIKLEGDKSLFARLDRYFPPPST